MASSEWLLLTFTTAIPVPGRTCKHPKPLCEGFAAARDWRLGSCCTAAGDAMRLHADCIMLLSPVMTCLGEQHSTNRMAFAYLNKVNASPVVDQLCHSRVIVAIELLEFDQQAPRLVLQSQLRVRRPCDVDQCGSKLLYRRSGGHSCSVGALIAPCG